MLPTPVLLSEAVLAHDVFVCLERLSGALPLEQQPLDSILRATWNRIPSARTSGESDVPREDANLIDRRTCLSPFLEACLLVRLVHPASAEQGLALNKRRFGLRVQVRVVVSRKKRSRSRRRCEGRGRRRRKYRCWRMCLSILVWPTSQGKGNT